MAVVSLNDQRVTIYAGGDKVLQAPVSTGQKGYETPAGIYSVIEKNREHYSNLYDDASMPFMQRLTWSGIALHAGILPGYPASHGCIRMPHEFAGQLFELSKLGLADCRARRHESVDVAHPAPFAGPDSPDAALEAVVDRRSGPMSPSLTPLGDPAAQTWRSIAAAKAALAEAAAKRAEDARRAAVKAGSEAAPFGKKVRLAEGAKLRAEAQFREAERVLETAGSPPAMQRAEELKTKALERLVDAQSHVDAAKAEGQAKIDAAVAAREEAKTAEGARLRHKTRRSWLRPSWRRCLCSSVEKCSVSMSGKDSSQYSKVLSHSAIPRRPLARPFLQLWATRTTAPMCDGPHFPCILTRPVLSRLRRVAAAIATPSRQ
jgi:hypothetical protein